MYAKWIHPQKIVIHEGKVLRHNGYITVNPRESDYIKADYYPVIIKEGQDLMSKDNIYIVREKTILILEEDKH